MEIKKTSSLTKTGVTMKIKKIAALVIALTASQAYASLPSASVMARDLNVWKLGWLGHVGLATDDYAPVQNSALVIEALNESPAIQINFIQQFMAASRYWGSRGGLVGLDDTAHSILVEANHQRWWEPEYTTSTNYDPGNGNIYTGKSTHHGYFRCDTFVAWCYYYGSNGTIPQLIDLKIMTPLNIFNTFPFPNSLKTDKKETTNPPFLDDIDQEFARSTPEELNEMDYEKFQTIADPDFKKTTPLHVQVEWMLAKSSFLSDTKRGIFIDRLAMMGYDGTITKFIEMYKTGYQDSEEIKDKIIAGLVGAYQKQLEKNKNFQEREMLLEFYNSMINKPTLSVKQTKNITYGFLALSSTQQITKSINTLDKNIEKIEEKSPTTGLGIRITLIHESPELEKIYLKKTIDHLRAAKSSDLDDMFFGTTSMGIRSFVDKDSIPLIKAYVEDSKEKYTADTKTLAKTDAHYGFARNEYQNLLKVL